MSDEQLSLPLRPALVWPPQVGAEYVVHWPNRGKRGGYTWPATTARCVEPRWPGVTDAADFEHDGEVRLLPRQQIARRV